MMKNYHFNLTVAKRVPLRNLFVILLGLVEVQRKATLYRAGVHTDLEQFGICSNLDQITRRGEASWLSYLFFKGEGYPIVPYWTDAHGPDGKREARWGHNDLGNQRTAMLNRMIKDLTHYLTNKA